MAKEVGQSAELKKKFFFSFIFPQAPALSSQISIIYLAVICICILRIKAYVCTSINKINNYYVLSYSNYYTKSNKQLL